MDAAFRVVDLFSFRWEARASEDSIGAAILADWLDAWELDVAGNSGDVEC